jgi:ribonuclease J
VTTIEFWGGLGVIGSSKILITHGEHRVLLDIGLDIPGGADLFRAPVRIRPEHELADRLRVGGAPRLPGLFDPAFLPAGDPLAEPVGPTAVFVSHPHLDHVGLAGFVRSDIPVYAHSDAVDLLVALAGGGQGLPGGDPDWRRLHGGDVVEVGELRVECVPVDHDVPGATGYLVHTPDGTLAYTGDIRFHGRNPSASAEFVRRATGCTALVTEGTLLSFSPPEGPVRTEDDVLAAFTEALGSAGGLIMLALYPRDVRRVEEFIEAAARYGRRIIWPAPVAAFLRNLAVPDVLTWGDGVDLAAVTANPAGFVVQPDPADLPSLLDLPLVPGDLFLHANGEPLGEFEPRWAVFTDWLASTGLVLRRIGASGHATADDLHAMVQRISPEVVFPIHTLEPTRLHPALPTRRVIPHYGEVFTLDGRVRTAEPVTG